MLDRLKGEKPGIVVAGGERSGGGLSSHRMELDLPTGKELEEPWTLSRCTVLYK